MIWPTLVFDNFFTDPDKIVEISKRYKYINEGSYPGVRTDLINYTFFSWSTLKILTLLYPTEARHLKWQARSHFQKVPANLELDGWVHRDIPAEFTVIIYLSKDGIGTSLFEPISPEITIPGETADVKYKFFKNTNISAEERSKVAEAREKNNAGFRETLSIKGKYNRLVLFDSSHYHTAHVFKGSESDVERLTYITFFDKIVLGDNKRNLKYPGSESRRT